MRVFVYLLDGVSALPFPLSHSNDKSYHRIIHPDGTFISEIFGKGLTCQRCYGYDCTAASLFTVLTGQEHFKSDISLTRNANLFLKIPITLQEHLRKNGYSTYFLSNNYKENNSIPLKGFEKRELYKEVYDISENSDFLKLKEEYLSKENSFVFFHDLYTHDQAGLYSRGKFSYTDQEYMNLLYKHDNELLPKNLDALGYNPEKDILVLFSDHGMTVGNDLDRVIAKDSEAWSLPSKEFKSRVLLNISGPGIETKQIEEPCALVDLPTTLLGALGLPIPDSFDGVNLLSAEPKGFAQSINVGNQSIKPPPTDSFVQFFHVEPNDSGELIKYIHQPNVDRCVSYNLSLDPKEEHPISMSFEDCPRSFQTYIEQYVSSRGKGLRNALSLFYMHVNSHLFKVYLSRVKRRLRALTG